MNLPQDDIFIENEDEGLSSNRPSLATILISLLILVAMLAVMILPLLGSPSGHRPPPTPTPSFLRQI